MFGCWKLCVRARALSSFVLCNVDTVLAIALSAVCFYLGGTLCSSFRDVAHVKRTAGDAATSLFINNGVLCSHRCVGHTVRVPFRRHVIARRSLTGCRLVLLYSPL